MLAFIPARPQHYTSMRPDEARLSRPGTRWAIIFAAWTLFGLAQLVLGSIMMKSWSTEYLLSMAISFMPRVWVWAALTPVIAMWDSIVSRRSHSILGRVALHFPLFIVMCLIQAVVRRTTAGILDPGPTVPFYVTVLFFADIEGVRYVACVMLGRVLQASRELVRRERRAVQLREEIAQAQLHYLDLQLQPHFLFNALGSISELAHEAPLAAARMVEHLTSLLRYATEPRSGQEVTLREELAALSPYLEIQRMRFPDWLSISETIEPSAEDAMVPRMLLQPLVENAIRHGLSHRQSGGLIIFGASVHGDNLVLSIYDNGAGLSNDGKPGLGIGLGNIRERLGTLYGDSQSLELLSHDEGGVEVLLRIPFKRSAVESRESASTQEQQEELAEGSLDVAPPENQIAKRALALLGGWLVAGVLMLALSLLYVTIRHPDSHEPYLEIANRHMIYSALWIVLTPIVISFARRFPISRARLAFTLPLHLVGGAVTGLVHLEGLRLLLGDPAPLFSSSTMDSLFWNLAAYWILVAFTQRTSIEEWIREKDVAAARMRAELTTARLSTVMVELKPDFLLSALATLRALVMVDAARAEHLLTSLADFLRLTLESLARQSITVERELTLLRAYGKVHRAAAGHFPDIDLDVPPLLESALVPTGVTRMLAERLMESGNIPDRIAVSLKRTDTALTIRIAPSNVSIVSGNASATRLRDPFGRLARLTDSGAVVRFSEETSSLEVDLPLNRGETHVTQGSPALALQFG
jgi:two-component system, LytTR family, sensor kinase